MTRSDFSDEVAAVRSTCQRIGLGDVAPVLLKAAHHASFLIASAKIVVRVQSDDPVAMATERAAKEMAVARHLAKRGAPALAPLEEEAGPHVHGHAVMTFWPYVEDGRAADEVDAPVAAMSLAAIHRSLLDFAGHLPPYTASLDRCWRVLSDDRMTDRLPMTDRHLLQSEFRRLRQRVETASAPWSRLHGDSHLGNLLIDSEGKPLWLDFEDACLGPREYDIANLPAEIWHTFPDADPELITVYARLKSICVAVWCSAAPHRSPEMQEAADYHLGILRDGPH